MNFRRMPSRKSTKSGEEVPPCAAVPSLCTRVGFDSAYHVRRTPSRGTTGRSEQRRERGCVRVCGGREVRTALSGSVVGGVGGMTRNRYDSGFCWGSASTGKSADLRHNAMTGEKERAEVVAHGRKKERNLLGKEKNSQAKIRTHLE